MTKKEGKTNFITNLVTKLYWFQLGAYKNSVIQHGLPLNYISKKSLRELKLPVMCTSFLDMYIPIKHPISESEKRLVPIVWYNGSKLRNSIWQVTFPTAICYIVKLWSRLNANKIWSNCTAKRERESGVVNTHQIELHYIFSHIVWKCNWTSYSIRKFDRIIPRTKPSNS